MGSLTLFRDQETMKPTKKKETMKDNRAMFKSMDTEIMQISILVDEMLEKLGSTAIMEDSPRFLHFNPMGEIERFHRTLLKLRDTLDAEASVEWWIIDDLGLGKLEGLIFEDEQLPRSETSGVLTWWRQLRAALETETAQDVLDQISINTSISQKEGFHIFTNRHKQRLRLFSDYSMETMSGVMITKVLKRLNDSILLKPPDPKRIDKQDVDSTHDIVGRQNDVDQIVELLMSSAHCETTSDSPNASVIPILGDSGLGKTTLAKLVYNDHRVERHFDKKVWVSFSNHYVDILETTKSLLQSSTIGEEPPNDDITDDVAVSLDHFKSLLHKSSTIGEEPPKDITNDVAASLDRLKSLLHKSLDGKRFLIVLDGVPNEICFDWGLLYFPLMTGKTSSRILVTTRSSLVSSTLGTIPPHKLQPLSFEDTWLLFTGMASHDNTSSTYPHLRCYQEMVEWFQGFPSLVIALKELPHSKPIEKEIEAALLEVRRDHNPYSRISPASLRTYHSLSSLHVKQCFLYCALFPKGYRLKKHKLVWLWMAAGFLQSNGSMTMEQVGFSYFEELLQKCYIECKYADFTHHESSSYIIPDLAQYVLQYMCGKEYLKIDSDETCFSEYTRHMSLCFERTSGFVSLCCKGISGDGFDIPQQTSSLQTLLLLGEFGSDDRSRFVKHVEKFAQDLLNFTRLRVLDISCTGMLELPDSICNLKNLRFLDISGSKLNCLPVKMSLLHNLQTLIIGGPDKMPIFPRGMGNLVSLRHLILGSGYESFLMPHGVGKLTNLQTLPAFVFGNESDECGSIEELKELKYLQGSLALMRLENVPLEKASQRGWLVDKAGIQELGFIWDEFDLESMHDIEIAENLLLGLKPHTNLKHLKLITYGGRKFPTWMGCPSFSNLETIELYACKNVEYLPPFGQLPSLKSLRLIMMDELKYIDNSFLGNHMDKVKRSFESLKFLKIAEISSLEKWTDLREGDMANLEELEISWCDMLISLPSFKLLRSLKKLTLSSCSKLELPSEGLPVALDSLFIWCCPLVSQRCSEEGEDKEAGNFDDKTRS